MDTKIETAQIKIEKLLCKFSPKICAWVCGVWCVLHCGFVDATRKYSCHYLPNRNIIFYRKHRMAICQLEHHLNYFEIKYFEYFESIICLNRKPAGVIANIHACSAI